MPAGGVHDIDRERSGEGAEERKVRGAASLILRPALLLRSFSPSCLALWADWLEFMLSLVKTGIEIDGDGEGALERRRNCEGSDFDVFSILTLGSAMMSVG